MLRFAHSDGLRRGELNLDFIKLRNRFCRLNLALQGLTLTGHMSRQGGIRQVFAQCGCF